MKRILTNVLIVFSPLYLLCQTVADTSFSFEETTDDFHEFRWQAELEVTYDTTFYYFKSVSGTARIELIDSSQAIIWRSKSVESTHSVPAELVRDKLYSIRLYGSLGITEVIWFP
jgi:hypothetical protein